MNINPNNTLFEQARLTTEGNAYLKILKSMKTKGDSQRARERLVTHILKMRIMGYGATDLEEKAGLI